MMISICIGCPSWLHRSQHRRAEEGQARARDPVHPLRKVSRAHRLPRLRRLLVDILPRNTINFGSIQVMRAGCRCTQGRTTLTEPQLTKVTMVLSFSNGCCRRAWAETNQPIFLVFATHSYINLIYAMLIDSQCVPCTFVHAQCVYNVLHALLHGVYVWCG